MKIQTDETIDIKALPEKYLKKLKCKVLKREGYNEGNYLSSDTKTLNVHAYLLTQKIFFFFIWYCIANGFQAHFNFVAQQQYITERNCFNVLLNTILQIFLFPPI